MAGRHSPTAESDLADEDIHHVLSNRRRRLILDELRTNGETQSVRDLSKSVGAAEAGTDPPPTNLRNSVYVSMHQTHLPKLDELGIITYDAGAKQVTLEDQADDVYVYMETVSKYELTWSEYYLGLAILGILTSAGASLGTPFLARFPSVGWAILTLAVIGLSAASQTIRDQRSILSRLRN